MVLVHADPVEAQLLGRDQLVEVPVVELVPTSGSYSEFGTVTHAGPSYDGSNPMYGIRWNAKQRMARTIPPLTERSSRIATSGAASSSLRSRLLHSPQRQGRQSSETLRASVDLGHHRRRRRRARDRRGRLRADPRRLADRHRGSRATRRASSDHPTTTTTVPATHDHDQGRAAPAAAAVAPGDPRRHHGPGRERRRS